MARSKHDSLEYAIKFFAQRSAFDAEAALYRDRRNPLGQFLPKVRCPVARLSCSMCVCCFLVHATMSWSGDSKGTLTVGSHCCCCYVCISDMHVHALALY